MQHDFLTWLQDSAEFCRRMEEEFPAEQGRRLPLWTEGLGEGCSAKLSEDEFRELSPETGAQMFRAWRAVPTEQARLPGFWGLATLRHIQNGAIESWFLVGTSGVPGKERIERALLTGTAREMDDIVRTALRRFSGLHEARGYLSVYADCVFGRAWWRNYLCEEICRNTGANPHRVSGLLHTSRTYWEHLVECVLYEDWERSRLKPLYALVWALSERLDKNGKSHLNGEKLRMLLQLMGISRRRKDRGKDRRVSHSED